MPRLSTSKMVYVYSLSSGLSGSRQGSLGTIFMAVREAGARGHLRLISRAMPVRTALPLLLWAAEAVDDAGSDARADEMRDVAAERADLLDEARGDELVAVGGHQKDGLDARVEAGVHPGHLEL